MMTIRANSPMRPRAAARRGFTVLEVLVATGILSIGFTAIFALLTHANSSHRRALDRTHAATLAASVFDDIALRYSTHWWDRDGNTTPDAFEDQNGNGVPDRFEDGRYRSDDYPALGPYRYSVRTIRSTYDPRPIQGSTSVREVFAIVRVFWRNQTEEVSETFHRLIFVRP